MSPAAGLSPSTYCPKADVESTFYRAQSFAGLAQRFGRLKCGGPMLDPVLSPLLGPLFASAAMRALLADRERLQRMLDGEAALARAEAAAGVIPQQAVAAIAAACRVDHYDLVALGEAAVDAGNVAIPLVKALTAEVANRTRRRRAMSIGRRPARTLSTPRWCSTCAPRSTRLPPTSTAP
jgi:hypothetical protein